MKRKLFLSLLLCVSATLMLTFGYTSVLSAPATYTLRFADYLIEAKEAKADKIIDYESSKVVYELPTISGEVLLLEADYTSDRPNPVVQYIKLLVPDFQQKDGIYTYGFMSKQGIKLNAISIYKNRKLVDLRIEPEIEIQKEWTEDNPFTLSLNSKAGYEINFNFYRVGGKTMVRVDPKINPWDIKEKKEHIKRIPPEEAQAAVVPTMLHPIRKNGKCGYINGTGKLVIEPKFDEAYDFFEELAVAKVGDKFGYINTKGDFVIEPQFDIADNFSGGLALIAFEHFDMKYINKEGEVVTKQEFSNAFPFTEGLAPVINVVDGEEEWSFIDKTGNKVLGDYRRAKYFSEGLAPVVIEEKFGFIDKSGKLLIDEQFEDVTPFSEGLAFVQIKDDKFGYIDKAGHLVIDLGLDFSLSGWGIDELFVSGIDFSFKEERAPICIDSFDYGWDYIWGWGYINKKGKIIVAPKFSKVQPFSEGLAAVLIDRKWGYINKEGEIAIEPKFYRASNFRGGIAAVVIDEEDDVKIGYIDKSGDYIWEPTN